MSVSQRRIPACTAGLNCNHLDETLVVAAEQRCCLRRLRHVAGGQVAAVVDQGAVAVLAAGGSAGIGVGLEQALVAGQQLRHCASFLFGAAGDRVLHVFERGVAFGDTFRIAVADLDHGFAIAIFGSGHALGQRLGSGTIAFGLRIGIESLHQQQRGNGEQGEAPGKRGKGRHARRSIA